MMSWNHAILLFLIVFLSMINMSKGNCNDYFTMDELKKNLTDTISIVETNDLKDAIECTLEREILHNQEERKHLLMCFLGPGQNKPNKVSVKCKGEPSLTVTLYHFKCLMAKALQLDSEAIGHTGCEYDTVLKIYSSIYKGFGQTTTLLPPPTTTAATTAPPTTAPTTTTTAPPTTAPTTTTTAPPTTAPTTAPTTTTTAPTTTTTTTTLPERTTAATTTTVLSPTLTAVSGVTGQSSHLIEKHETSNTYISTVLIVSMILNVLLPLGVYLYMRSKRSQDYRPPTELNGASPDDPPAAEMELTPVNRDKEEVSRLMQSSNNPHHEQALGNSDL